MYGPPRLLLLVGLRHDLDNRSGSYPLDSDLPWALLECWYCVDTEIEMTALSNIWMPDPVTFVDVAAGVVEASQLAFEGYNWGQVQDMDTNGRHRSRIFMAVPGKKGVTFQGEGGTGHAWQ